MAVPRKKKAVGPEVVLAPSPDLEVGSYDTSTTVVYSSQATATTTNSAGTVITDEFTPVPQIAGREEFRRAVWLTGPEGFDQVVKDELHRHRTTRDGVTPEALVLVRAELTLYCQRVDEWRNQ